MSNKLPKKRPEIVKIGSASARIYRRDFEKNGREYREFKLTYYGTDGRRKFESFADYAECKARALAVVGSISKGEARTLVLTSDQTLIFNRAVSALAPCGIALDVAAAEYAEARKIIGPEVRLKDAATFYVEHQATVAGTTVAEAVAALLALKEGTGKSAIHVKDLRLRLGKFEEGVVKTMDMITARDVEVWLLSLKCGGRSRENYLGAVRSLFKFAVKRGWSGPLDFNKIETTNSAEDEGEVKIFTPAEMATLLKAARPEMIPFLVLGAFAGIRSAEITRLDWSAILWATGYIRLNKGKAKTRSNRMVPILPVLSAWLEPHKQDAGKVCPFLKVDDQLQKLAAKSGVKWQHNGLRHSFGTYRMAIVKSENQVAIEMGNTPAMIFAHYRKTVTEEQAAEWFNIMPEGTAENVGDLSRREG